MSSPKEEKSLEGDSPPLDTEENLQEAVRKAIDYRGDVTIGAADGRTIVGYVYTTVQKNGECAIRIYPKDEDEELELLLKDVRSIHFSGKDTAFGKSWEAWIRRHENQKTETKNL